jgi:hypothetical protein
LLRELQVDEPEVGYGICLWFVCAVYNVELGREIPAHWLDHIPTVSLMDLSNVSACFPLPIAYFLFLRPLGALSASRHFGPRCGGTYEDPSSRFRRLCGDFFY